MPTIEESIQVAVPVRTAYNQWTQFEEFPRFMEGIEKIEQLDDRHLRWTAQLGGRSHTWEAKVTEQDPDQRIAWTSTQGKFNAGVVTFHRIDDHQTRIMVQMDWQPEGLVEKVGGALGFDDRQLRSDLERFKALIEERGAETGAWRGEVDQEKVS